MLTRWADFETALYQLNDNLDLTLERLEKLSKLELDLEVRPLSRHRGKSISGSLLSLLRSWPWSAVPRFLNIHFSSVGVQLGDGKTVAFAVTRQEYLEFLRECAQAVERLAQEGECISAPRCPTRVCI